MNEKQCPQLYKMNVVSVQNEKRTLLVVIITAITMVLEIYVGTLSNSMALLADGWHMGTHAFALGISYAAYVYSRKMFNSGYFSFGTGKIGVLSGYTSSLFLGITAVWLIFESFMRFFHPLKIAFNEAIIVAVIGLAVNIISICILGIHNNNDCDNDERVHHDHNYLAAYFHVLADALTSVFAIAALSAGKIFNLTFLDPVIGIVGGLLILSWAFKLVKNSAKILLDVQDTKNFEIMKKAIESDGCSKLTDWHIWNIGSNDVCAIVSISTNGTGDTEEYKNRISSVVNFTHINIEIQRF